MPRFIQNQQSKLENHGLPNGKVLILELNYRWGKKNEPVAKKKFRELLLKLNIHKGFVMKDEIGLRRSTKHPHLAASCDFLFDCSCDLCSAHGGRGVGEVKCPWSHQNHRVKDAAKADKNFALFVDEAGELKLKSNHQYYYQVQVQMNVTDRKFALFVCFTKVDLCHVFVPYDSAFVDRILGPTRDFFIQVVLPELVAKTFTNPKKQSCVVPPTNPSYMVCICGISDEKIQTLRCSNENCMIKSFHVPCILKMLKRKTLPKVFKCADCQKEEKKLKKKK